jgi:hypothetical protein
MYFLLATICALIGIIILLSRVKPNKEYHIPIIDTDRWIDHWEITFQNSLRKILRFVVIHLVGWYRFVIHDITIHKTMKKKVRELLYEHHREQKVKSTRLSIRKDDN